MTTVDTSTFPQPGFYRKYNFDPAGPIHDHVFEVCGMGSVVSAYSSLNRRMMVVFRPLDPSKFVYTNLNRGFDLMTVEEFTGTTLHEKRLVKKYTFITDRGEIEELEKRRDELYN